MNSSTRSTPVLLVNLSPGWISRAGSLGRNSCSEAERVGAVSVYWKQRVL